VEVLVELLIHSVPKQTLVDLPVGLLEDLPKPMVAYLTTLPIVKIRPTKKK
jgi:hypothetical protein